jgi:superfamily II DNA or RNA helicase
MSKYPNLTDSEYYNKINNTYKDYKISNKKPKFDDICFPKNYQLQLPQLFVSKYINPHTPYTRLLIYHQIGAGKTCAAIQIAEAWKNIKKIIIVLPASLIGNFRAELRSLCGKNHYLDDKDRNKLKILNPRDIEYKNIIKISDNKINAIYNIYSYNKFIQLLEDKEINLKNTLLIIDEIQNMISDGGTYYETLYNAVHSAPSDLRLVLLSATPIFDKPNEIALTMNLLLPKKDNLPTSKEFDKKFINKTHNKLQIQNSLLLKEALKGYISYFRGAPSYVFPNMTVKYVKCEMSDFQYNAYKDVSKLEAENAKFKEEDKTVKNLPNNFFIGTRIVSNIVFPNRQINEEGFKSLKGNKILEKLDEYSIKFARIIRKLETCSGKIFVYSSFKEYGGIKSFARVLEEFGYTNYNETGKTGTKRFAIWSGDETNTVRDEIRAIYNNKNNLKGKKIKILLGSPSIKEGVSLTAVKQVHILEPYWNQARLDQIIGRASRYCSHKDVPEEERYVKVYIYIAVHPKEKITVDEYIHELSNQKNKLVRDFERALKETAIDCSLNKYANIVDEGEEPIKCME